MEPYKFPDEEAVDENLEIEIDNDAPPEDRNKEPLPENIKEDLYNDELEDYSTKVKTKLLQLKKLAHDERRDKEAASRREQEALTLAQKVLEENKKLKSSLNDSEKNVVDSVQKAIELEVQEAKRFYREAYESGDPDKVLEAQEKLTQAALRAEKAKNIRFTPLQEDENEVKINQQVAQSQQSSIRRDPTAVAWQEKNQWFGQDRIMTATALALHEQLKEEGVPVSSQEYYRRIDDTMKKRFPENFESDTQEVEVAPTRKPSTVVAPATRSTSPKKIRLKQSQLDIAKKLGLTAEQYANAALKMEA
jgi:hypothetical protein